MKQHFGTFFSHNLLILLLLLAPMRQVQAQTSQEEGGQYIREIDELLANISVAFSRWEKSLNQPDRDEVDKARSQLSGWVYHARITMESRKVLPEDPGFMPAAKGLADFMHNELHNDEGRIGKITRFATDPYARRSEQIIDDYKRLFDRLLNDAQSKEGRVQFMRLWIEAKFFEPPPPASFCTDLSAMGTLINTIFPSFKGESFSQPHPNLRDYALAKQPDWAIGGTATLNSGYPELRFLCHSTKDSTEALNAVQSLVRKVMLCNFAEFSLGWVEYGANLASTREFWVNTSMTYKLQNFRLAATLIHNEEKGFLETYLVVAGKSKLPE